MKKYILTLLAAVLFASPLVAQSYTAQAGVSLFTGASAVVTQKSGNVRLSVSGAIKVLSVLIVGRESRL